MSGPLQRRRQRSPNDDQGRETPDGSSGDGGRRRRPKRRKLDLELPPPPRNAIKYGHYGQVEPGRLKLDIISCDGGEHTDPQRPEIYLGPKNLLRLDKSVYCSDRQSATVILHHLDNTPFCLEKLHIVGPEHGFTAPVREGLVYVAMTLADLQKHIDPPAYARRAGIHSPPYRRETNLRGQRSEEDRPGFTTGAPERLTINEALRDPELNAAFDHHDDYARRADMAHDLAASPRDYYSSGYLERADAEAHCELPSSSSIPTAESGAVLLPSESRASLPVTLLSDEETGPEESSSQEVLDYRLQRLRWMRRRFDIENWDRDERWNGLSNLHINEPSYERDREGRERDGMYGLNRLDALMSGGRYRSPPPPRRSDDTPPYPPPPIRNLNEASTAMSGKGVDSSSDDTNVTCARFHIKYGKHKVAVKFDPPVSGRFMLLKLWSDAKGPRANVDVQSVIAKGFGGPRFFPAKEFR